MALCHVKTNWTAEDLTGHPEVPRDHVEWFCYPSVLHIYILVAWAV